MKKMIVSNFHNRYSGILSLSDISLFLVDRNGEILHEFISSPDFCTNLCKESSQSVCSDYRKQIKNRHYNNFFCKYGLNNIILPIEVDNEIMGFIGGMQVYLKENEYKKYMVNAQSFTKENDVKLEFIAKAIGSLKTVESNKIVVHEQLCHHIAKNIALDLKDTINEKKPHVSTLSIEKEMLEKKIIDLEVKNMSLVVNPHFVFNTLNSIARIAYFEKSHTIEELIYCLSDLLRYNLNQGDQLHTVAAEIDNIEKYLHIQKVRFRSRLDYVIDVPDQVQSMRIPNMIIQPIVDNAINHGITGNRDGGIVKIYAESMKNTLIIFVADNGNGFPQEVYNKIHRGDCPSGYGFSSTDKRLKQYYGNAYGLKIVKSDFSGSTVSITIPKKHPGGV
ncbi:histidine kinase [Alkaliphilus metalliredigens]|nr:histidine kinase [Alkaliphilus metalliredigens]